MKITRKFTTPGTDPFATVEWTRRSSRISNPDGSVVFEMDDAEVPKTWSQLATDIMVSKYFRKAGVPADGGSRGLASPDWDEKEKDTGKMPVPLGKETPTGPEKSARQVIHRMAGCWRHWGETHGYFDTPDDAQAFYDELVYMLVHQIAAPNSPQWFNTGLNWAYGITGPAQGHYVADPITGEIHPAPDAYTHPQPHACQPFDALVSTPQGPIPIGRIVEKTLVGLEVYDGSGEDGAGTTRVVAAKANGEKPVYRIVLKHGGSVEATGDHLVFATDERRSAGDWLRVDEVRPGMKMRVSSRTCVTKESSQGQIRDAALVGWLQGDGFVGQYHEGTNRSLTIELITINEDEYEHVLSLVRTVFEGVHFHVRHVDSADSALDIKRIRLYGESLRPFVEKYGLLREGEEIEVPEAILSAGAGAQSAYLRSLFQADGTVRMRRRATRSADVVLTTTSHALAGGVQTLLLNLGIYARVQRGTEKRQNRRIPWFVTIGYAQARERYRDLIGFVSSEKRDNLDMACSEEFPGKSIPAIREETVLRVELIGSMPVFDIQTESGQYLSNNVLVHNCFIQSVDDDLVNDGGIMDLWVREARLFKYGSGTGTNFSKIRADYERLSGGGKSSGLMSWLKIGDRAAGAIKSGGTTRRAAKMVCLDMDHPDIETFVNWKVREELKVAAMVEGLKRLPRPQRELAERMGLSLDYDFNGEAYQTVSGQNANNSVRIPDDYFDTLDADGSWKTTWRTTGEVARAYNARALWDQIAYATWRCADPGVQFDTTINAWHTCPEAGRINASNPCSEYMFLDNTACNLASINLLKFYDAKRRTFDVASYEHAIDLWTVVLEISVLMAAFPSERMAELSYRYRTLGLGLANLGAMLMQAGVPYDSDEGRCVGAMVAAIMTGRSYRQSALLSAEHDPFAGYEDDAEHMLRVIRNHRRAAQGKARDSDRYERLRIRPVPIDHGLVRTGRIPLVNAAGLLDRAVAAWDEALSLGEEHGYRNAQVSVIAPTGTIGLLMDCDTTGVEPDFALVKFKKLAGGGCFKIANGSVRPALEALGYTPEQIREIMTYLLGTLSLDVPIPASEEEPGWGMTLSAWLVEKGLGRVDIERIGESLPGMFELSHAFGSWVVGDEVLERVGIDPEEAKADSGFNLLCRLGLSEDQVEALNRVICGTQTIEGAPHIAESHLPVFDCASRCGKSGKRYIRPEGHIRMMAAAQPFISGAISKTINLPGDATVEDIKSAYRLSWELGLKANALYRDGCKLSQPLSAGSDAAMIEDEEDEDAIEAAREEVAQDVAELAVAAASGDEQHAARKEVQIVQRPLRRRLPDTRQSLTHKFNVAGHEGYLTVGLYENGAPGELFITMAKEGSTIGGLMDSLGTCTSVALQYGVPVASLVNKFTHQRFEPAGMTTNDDIPFAKSLVDYIFRWIGMEFIAGYREANAPVRPSKTDSDERETPGAEQRVIGEGRLRHPAQERRVAPRPVPVASESEQPSRQSALSAAMQNMGDAPPCDVCGTITVRNGTCYKCMNCGNSMGCS